jgi:hypothetical protein
MSDLSEARIHQELFTWHWNTYPEHRMQLFMIHNTPKNRIDGARLKAMGMVAGVADLCFLGRDGVTVFLEMKTDIGVQSWDQKRFEEVCKKVGAKYFLVRSVLEGQELIKKFQ